MAKYVGFVTIGADQSMPIAATLYGTCSTVATAAQKDVTLDALTNITAGVTVHVKFTNANTANKPTLHFSGMNSETAIAIKNNGTDSSITWAAGALISFTYDGTNWVMHDANTTYSAISEAEVKSDSSTTARLVTGQRVNQAIDNKLSGITDTLTGNPAASKTITAFDQVNGKVSATFADIAIAESQVSGLVTDLGLKAPLASPEFTGTPKAPTASAGTNTTQIATTAFVIGEISSKLASNDAMLFKGTLGTGGTITTVPASGYQAGWTYRIITAGTYAGVKCEVGDLLIAIKDGPSSGSSITNADWTVAQTNIDGAVTSTGKTGDTNKPVYIAANGIATAINYTINKSVPSNAIFSDTTYTATANTTIHYLNDANYIKTASVDGGVLTITAITNASTIKPVTAINPTTNGAT